MAKQTEYAYILYDEHGTCENILYGTTLKVVLDYYKMKGWTSVTPAGIGKKHSFTILPGQHVGKIYGRDKNKKNRAEQFKCCIYVRENVNNMTSEVPFQRNDFITRF